MNQQYIQMAIDYKKNVASKFMLVEGAKIQSRLAGESFWVTRKIDGHMQCLFYEDGQVFMLNSNGKQRADQLKCMDMFAGFMGKAGVSTAVMAAELYLPREEGRPRCGDVARALADDTLRDQLSLAVFDIISINGEAFCPQNYGEVHTKLVELLRLKAQNKEGKTVYKTTRLCTPVEMRQVAGIDEVKQIYQEWVEEQGAEGLVVHTDNLMVAKIKPRHTIDAAVIGYTTSITMVRDLMFAVALPDGTMQMFAVGGNGLNDEQRQAITQRLSNLHVESQYVLSDSRGVAYQMVKPEIVMELSVLELVARGNDDKIRTNPILLFNPEQGWLMQGMVPGVSALGLTIDRERSDKSVNPTDVRVSQLSDICPFEENDNINQKGEPSTLLARRVFKKVSGEKVMIHKFLLWKTNKESNPRFPAYIFYHTDYSSSRKEMIKRDMAYSSDEQQVRDIFESEIASNIKKGWEEIL